MRGQFLQIAVQAWCLIPKRFDVAYTCGSECGSAPLCLGVGGEEDAASVLGWIT